MKNLIIIAAAIVLLFSASCKKAELQPAGVNNTPGATARSTNGTASSISAYYDSAIFTIHFVEFSSVAEAKLITHNKSINFIYQSDPGLPGGQPFISVIDAVPGDGFNPIWQEVQIAFNTGVTPRQLYSDNEVLALASGPNPQITLTTTNEVYWCPVVGKK